MKRELMKMKGGDQDIRSTVLYIYRKGWTKILNGIIIYNHERMQFRVCDKALGEVPRTQGTSFTILRKNNVHLQEPSLTSTTNEILVEKKKQWC